MAWENILYEEIGAVARITLNRAERRNALNERMILDLDEATKKADADPNIRVMLIRGAGSSFSSGHDLSRVGGFAAQPGPATVESRWSREEELFLNKSLAIRNLKKPTIAAIHGDVVVGGLMLVVMCDLVIAAENTRLWVPSLRQRATGGEVPTLHLELGFRKAKEYLWTGDVVPIHVAERCGMVNRVVPDDRLDAEALSLAERIALMPPVTLGLSKRQLNKMQEMMGMATAFEYNFVMHQLVHATQEAAEYAARSAQAAKEKGVKGIVEARDGPFDEQAKKVY